ncbi:MAG: class F sortase [Clostridia bacterium]|nr:class F sortase [Clostridia bacterium]
METICPLTGERCPYQKLLIDGVCENQLTCPVVDVSFNQLNNPRKKLSRKLILIFYYTMLGLLLGGFIYIFFFTDYLRNNDSAEKGAGISESNDNDIVVLISNDTSQTPVESSAVLEEIPVTDQAATAISQIKIDSLSAYAEVISVGLNQYNLIETFPSRDIVSWYGESALPGENGNCILVGNKYYNNFTAVFHDLDKIKINDDIILILDNGTRITQKVYDIVYYKGNILPEKVLNLDISYSVTTLISRAGELDQITGDYDSFIVVLAR